MSDLISRQAAIDALGNAHFKNYGTAIIVIQALPSAQPEWELWKERYEDLLDYMHGYDVILKDRKEFKAWLERCRWHVLECDKLARQLEAQSEQKWIPVSEKLPEVRQWVLCQCRAGIMDVLQLTEDGSWDKGYPNVEYMGGFVVAWMPLPKAYEVEE